MPPNWSFSLLLNICFHFLHTINNFLGKNILSISVTRYVLKCFPGSKTEAICCWGCAHPELDEMVVPIYVVTRLPCLQSRYLYNLVMVVNSMSTWLSCGAQIFGWTVIQMLLWRQLLSGVVFKGVDTEQSILPSTMCCPLFNQPGW